MKRQPQPQQLLDMISSTWLKYGFILLAVASFVLHEANTSMRVGALAQAAEEAAEVREELKSGQVSIEQNIAVTQSQYQEIIRRLDNIEQTLKTLK